MSELQGRVLKNYNGFYYVAVEGITYACKVRGRMKQNRFSLVTGDQVAFVPAGRAEGMIVRVLPRKNFLRRPALANLDLLAVTFACATPAFSYLLADKLLVFAAQARIPALLILNKCDLATAGEAEAIRDVYAGAGYEVHVVSTASGAGIDGLRECLRGRICAFGGPSGAGKSSLANAVDPTVSLRTGSVSGKTGRGRHTTGYAQLLPFDGGYIADTPGFGNLLMENFAAAELADCFPEFAARKNGCRFLSCSHLHEPGCAVRAAVESGEIAASRYRSYIDIFAEIKDFTERQG